MLAKVYKWFTESFDTADLKDAKALVRRYEQMIGFANRQSIKALRGPGPIE